MLEGAYKLMVITFELINIFVIFQAIMNNLSRMKEVDLIFSYFFSYFYFIFDLFSFI